MKRLTPYLIILLLIPAMFSCETESVVVQEFENQTNVDIRLVLHHNFSETTDTILIPANSTIERYFDAESSASVSKETPFGDVDSVEFLTPDDVFLHSDILNSENWTINSDYSNDFSGVESESYHFTFRTEDVWKITRGNV